MVDDAVEGVRFGRYAVFEDEAVEVEGVRRAEFIAFGYIGVADDAPG